MSTVSPIDPFLLATERRRREIPAMVLARKLGVKRSELSNFENGNRPLPDAHRKGTPFKPAEAARIYMAALRELDEFLSKPVKVEVAA